MVNAEFVESALSLAEKAVSSDAPSDSGYLCCAIAIDTSRAGWLLKFAGFCIGIATAALLVYKIWAGVKEVLDKGTRRALRWASSFISKELLLTVDPPSDTKEGAKEQGKSRLLQRELIAPVIKLFGEFLAAVESGDEEAADRIRGHLGEARSEIEKSGWKNPPTSSGTGLYFLYSDDEDDRPPPEGSNWRATGKIFKSQEEGKEYCRNLMKGNPRIGMVMFYDYVYGDWTARFTRENILSEEKPPVPK